MKAACSQKESDNMPIAETLQPEAGDDRNKEVEIAKLEEIYNMPEYGPGDMVPRQISKFGHLALSKEHIKWPMIHH